MALKTNFELMADYNQWMNQNIYHAATKLNEQELHLNRGAFFGSILGTLNHIVVGDTFWLKRFAEHPAHFVSLEPIRKLNQPKGLDTVVYDDLAQLTQHRTMMDNAITAFTQELTDEILESTLSYNNSKGLAFNKKLGELIQHFFNHQTHHRGQVSTLFSQAGIDIGVTDLLMRIPDQE